MSKERVLVIDDEDFILQLCRDILTKSNYDVETASNGETGIKLLDDKKYDLIITDIKMPNISGLDVIKYVRESNKEVPIIVITAHGTLDVAIDSLKLGAHGFILKPFTPIELRTAVTEALEKTRLLSENIRMYTLMPLFEVSREMISEINPTKLLKLIVNIAVKGARADEVYIALIDETTGKLSVKESYGLSPDFLRGFEDRGRENMARLIVEDGRPLFIIPEAELTSKFEKVREIEGVYSGIYIPLITRGNIIGVLCVTRTKTRQPFTLSEAELVSVLGGQAAAAIDNARLYEKLEHSYLSMMVALSCVIEARDLYTDRHMKEIAEYSIAVAKRLGLSKTDIENIRRAALLHDIGKISVPDSILLKKGELSESEIEVVKKHPITGVQIIRTVEAMKEVGEIVKYHQERYDGSGYPEGLRGEHIPLGARIVAVADAFGAMITDRPYRKALPVEKAIEELRRCSGTQFDPDIVRVFISILSEKGIL